MRCRIMIPTEKADIHPGAATRNSRRSFRGSEDADCDAYALPIESSLTMSPRNPQFRYRNRNSPISTPCWPILAPTAKDAGHGGRSRARPMAGAAEAAERRCRSRFLPKDANDEKSAILEIRRRHRRETRRPCSPATLFRMYAHYADAHGWKTELISPAKGRLAATRKSSRESVGPGVLPNLKFESGVSRSACRRPRRRTHPRRRRQWRSCRRWKRSTSTSTRRPKDRR